MVLNICYKALYNTIERSNFEKSEHKRLIEKSQKLDSIVATMKERGESAEYIDEVRTHIKVPYLVNNFQNTYVCFSYIDIGNFDATGKRNSGKS